MSPLIRFWPHIGFAVAGALAVLFFSLWQGAREDVGRWKEAHRQAAAQSVAFEKQLKAANDKIRATAQAGAVSYGQCQDLAATDVSRAFDRGVLFGRSTCAAPQSPSVSPFPPARPSPSRP